MSFFFCKQRQREAGRMTAAKAAEPGPEVDAHAVPRGVVGAEEADREMELPPMQHKAWDGGVQRHRD